MSTDERIISPRFYDKLECYYNALVMDHFDPAMNTTVEVSSACERCDSPIEVLFMCGWQFLMLMREFTGSPVGGKHKLVDINEDQHNEMVGLNAKSLFVIESWPGRNDLIGETDFVGTQIAIGSYRADFILWRCEYHQKVGPMLMGPLVVECDGADFHDKHDHQVSRDRRRDRTFQISGYDILRFSGKELFKDVGACVEEVDEWFSNASAELYRRRKRDVSPE